MNALIEEIKAKTDEIKQMRAKLVAELRPTFKDLFVPFFSKWPQVSKISWAQYTPYFNDGDTCKFGVNEPSGYLGTDDEDEYEGSLSSYSEVNEDLIEVFGSKKAAQEAIEDFVAIDKEMDSIPEEVYKDLFGDHAKITVTSEGLDVEEYEHD